MLYPEKNNVSKAAIKYVVISENKHEGSRLWGEVVGVLFPEYQQCEALF